MDTFVLMLPGIVTFLIYAVLLVLFVRLIVALIRWLNRH